MFSLWDSFQKEAAKKKVPVSSEPAAPAAPTVNPLAGWHPDWTPPAGWWHAEENPGGWRQPARESQKKELFLWDQWKKSGEDATYGDPLVRSMKNIIYKFGVAGWVNRVPIAKPVLEQNALNLALGGMRNYDPTKALLSSHVTNQLKSMNRFVKKRQNFTRITEDRVKLYGPFATSFARLKEELDREPTLIELADAMKVPVPTLEKFLAEKRDDLIASGAKDDPFIDETPQMRLTLRLVRYELSPDEMTVFDYLTGQGGKPEIKSTGEIARREGWADSKVSQLKNAIMKKIEAAR